MSNETEITSDPARNTLAGVLGTLGLFFALGVLALGIVDSNGGIPFSLPRSWYTNRSMWYLLAMGSFAGGWFLLKRSSLDENEENRFASRASTGSDIRFREVILYTRVGCHLCDEMRQLLEKYARFLPAIDERDIDADATLRERFTECVPVLEIDGKIRFRGRINEILLRRLIDATPPRVADSSDGRNEGKPDTQTSKR